MSEKEKNIEPGLMIGNDPLSESNQESQAEKEKEPGIFYHVSSAKLKPGDVLEPGKSGYICLATSIEQAIYWASALYGRDVKDNKRGDIKDCTVYKVKTADENVLVEDCVGHYSFEYPGEMKMAKDVKPHSGDLDGELNVRDSPVTVVGSVEINLSEEAPKLMEKIYREIEENDKKEKIADEEWIKNNPLSYWNGLRRKP